MSKSQRPNFDYGVIKSRPLPDLGRGSVPHIPARCEFMITDMHIDTRHQSTTIYSHVQGKSQGQKISKEGTKRKATSDGNKDDDGNRQINKTVLDIAHVYE